jgi:NAD(P) transhydrogenase subunit alpha
MGGNCELSECNKTVVKEGVIIVGEPNIPATVPVHATEMYAKNIFNFVSCMIKDKKLNLDMEDEVIAKSLVVKDGEIVFEPVKELLGGKK